MDKEQRKVNDIFRRINMMNEVSARAQDEDSAKFDHITRKLVETIDGFVEVEDVKDKKDFITFAKEAIGQVPYEVKFKKLDERAVIPTYAHDGDVGMDLTAIDVEYDSKTDCYIYHTGLAFETDKHYGIFLFARSSNRKTEAYICNHVGIADSAIYRGEILICYKNRTSLRQYALESRMIEFFNAVEDGKRLKDAVKESVKGWTEAMNNPMLFAPYKVGEAVAQVKLNRVEPVDWIEVEELNDTSRGADGGLVRK